MEKAILVKLLLISPNVSIISFGLKISDLLFKKRGEGQTNYCIEVVEKYCFNQENRNKFGSPKELMFYKFYFPKFAFIFGFPRKGVLSPCSEKGVSPRVEGKGEDSGKVRVRTEVQGQEGVPAPAGVNGCKFQAHLNCKRGWKEAQPAPGGWVG